MRTEVIRNENTSDVLCKARIGAIRDVGARKRHHDQNEAAAIQVDQDLSAERPQTISLKARTFQMELYKRAKRQNTIAVLDTGSGKTFIAAMLIRDVITDEHKARQLASATACERPRKLGFFIVDKVALAVQQARFLQKTCPGTIGVLYGALGVDSFSKAQWEDIYESNDIVVLTADILKDCLARSLISMERISLLIFDECHHCQNAHAFALIQRHYYHSTEPSLRPKVFGMTASPVGCSKSPEKVIDELEMMMDATVCTPDPQSGLSDIVVRPVERFCIYPKRVLCPTYQNPIYEELECLLSSLKSLRRLIGNARYATNTMGPWASGLVWQMLLEDIEWRAEARSRQNNSARVCHERDLINKAKVMLESISQTICRPVSMTPKVEKLIAMLKTIYGPTSKFTDAEDTPVVIVFTERRVTAYLLMRLVNELLRDKMPSNLKACLFIGHGSTDEGDISMPMQRQALVLDKFRQSGHINCLFATSVAEEGIDVPACNYVIRFEPAKSCLQYIQSRGRARKSGSCYITMIEEEDTNGFTQHARIKEAEAVVRKICSTLPDDRIVRGTESELEVCDQAADHGSLPAYAAIAIVESFCRSLPADEFVSAKAEYSITMTGSGFVATCTLPPVSEVPTVCGGSHRTKREAKAEAALCAVNELYDRKLLDENYNPLNHTRSFEVPEDYDLSWNYKLRQDWPYRGPSFWKHGLCAQYYLTLVKTDRQGARQYADLLVVTKSAPLVKLPQLDFYDQTEVFHITCKNIDGPTILSAQQEMILLNFTDRLLKVMVNKKFVSDMAAHPYFLAIPTGMDDSNVAIDWREMKKSYYDSTMPLTSELICTGLPDAILREGWYNYYYMEQVRPDLCIDSPLPADDKRYRGSKESQKIRTWYEAPQKSKQKFDGPIRADQAIIKATSLTRKLNFLSPPSSKTPRDEDQEQTTNAKHKTAYLLTQYVGLVNMRASVVSMAMLIPSLITRIDSFLIAQELNDMMGTKVNLSMLVEAITMKQANHGCDYERLEYVGDAYLKLISTMAVYLEFPHYHEGLLTMKRTVILENKNLRRQAIKRKLTELIRSQPFSKPAWRPDLVLVEGETELPARVHILGNKQIADVVEAIIGAAVYDQGFDAGLKAAVALGVETYGVTSWDQFRSKYASRMPKFLSKKRYVHGEAAVSKALNYKFQNPNYLEQALRHGSCLVDEDDPIPSYQRLELIGDAVLEIEVAFWLMKTFPHYDPDKLTKMKCTITVSREDDPLMTLAHLVRNKSLGSICESLDLARYIRHFNGGVPAAMFAYSQQLAFLKARSTKSDYYDDCEAPKFMADVLESILGAIFLDDGMDTRHIREIFHAHFLTRLDPDVEYGTRPPVMGVLSQLLQKYGCGECILRKREDVQHATLDHKIAHRRSEPVRVITCTLLIHGTEICTVEAESYGLAKLKLGEAALKILHDPAGETTTATTTTTTTTRVSPILARLCTCPARQKPARKHAEEDEFSF